MVDSITVEVGAGKIKFRVFEAVIRKSSTFFDNAMKRDWATSRPEPRLIDLTDQDPEIFKIYLHWLYFKTFPTVLTENSATNTTSNTEFVTLGKCYVMGEMLMDIGFKNAVLDALLDSITNQPYYEARFPGQHAIGIIYDGTLEGAPARRLLVDLWVTEATENWAEYMTSDMPAAFTQDLARALLGRKRKKSLGRSWEERAKDYHET
jgi:hypothetical protein